MEWWCSSLALVPFSYVLLKWGGREPPFIGGEEGCLWKMFHPHMVSTKPPCRYVESTRHLVIRLWRGSMNRPSKVGLEPSQHGCGCTMGAPAPLLGHLESNFVRGLLWSSRVGLCWCSAKMRWFGWNLALFSIPSGPDSAGCGPLFPFAMCRMEMCFAWLRILGHISMLFI